MPRELVNDDPTQTCSAGLHVASIEYAKNFASDGVLVVCEVNPEHVVAIPIDYDQQKMRVCEYKVVEVLEQVYSRPYIDDHKDVADTLFEPMNFERANQIRAFYKQNPSYTYRQIALKFKTTKHTVSHIIRNNTWTA
jgi:hypothetical protein